MTNGMKYDNALNLVWLIVWAVVLVGVVAGIWWRPALYVVAIIAAANVGMFVKDYIYISRMK